MITREDLANKKIDKLENIEQAKEANNGKTTLALVIAGLQNISN